MSRFLSRAGFQHAWRSRVMRIGVVIPVLGVLMVASAHSVYPVLADDPMAGPSDYPPTYIGDGTPSSGVIGQNLLGADQQAILAKKAALSNMYMNQVRMGTYSSSDFAVDFKSFLTAVGVDASTHYTGDHSHGCGPEGQVTSDTSCLDPEMAVPASNGSSSAPYNLERDMLFYIPQYAQVTDFYCGPAAAWEVLAGKGYTTSASGWYVAPGDAYSGQHAMGSTCTYCSDTRGSYLQTNFWRNTPWDLDPTHFNMSWGLNNWAFGLPTQGFYAPTGLATGRNVTVDIYKGDLITDIDNGWPVVVDAVEWPGKAHLDQHPQLQVPIYHWATVRGYWDYGNESYYVDSVYGALTVTWHNNVTKANHSVTTQQMVEMMTVPGYERGYVW